MRPVTALGVVWLTSAQSFPKNGRMLQKFQRVKMFATTPLNALASLTIRSDCVCDCSYFVSYCILNKLFNLRHCLGTTAQHYIVLFSGRLHRQ